MSAIPMGDMSANGTDYSYQAGLATSQNPGGQFANLPPTGMQFDNPFVSSSPFPSSVDPAQFIWAVSSRLPTVEEASPNDERSSVSGPSPTMGEIGQPRSSTRLTKDSSKKTGDGKLVKVTWWRPHGQTAIAPGMFQVALPFRNTKLIIQA
jgi:hypothetical protein